MTIQEAKTALYNGDKIRHSSFEVIDVGCQVMYEHLFLAGTVVLDELLYKNCMIVDFIEHYNRVGEQYQIDFTDGWNIIE